MKFSTPKGSWVVTVLLAAIATGYIFMFFLPGWKSIEALRKQIRAKIDYIAQGDATAAALATAAAELERTRAYNAAWCNSAPTAADLSAVFERITELTKAAGVSTMLFDPEPIVKRERISQINLAMGLRGSCAQIHDFLGKLESLPARIWVESLRMALSGKNGENVVGTLSTVIFINNSEDSDYVKRGDQPIK